jgi:hypothetical protein
MSNYPNLHWFREFFPADLLYFGSTFAWHKTFLSVFWTFHELRDSEKGKVNETRFGINRRTQQA